MLGLQVHLVYGCYFLAVVQRLRLTSEFKESSHIYRLAKVIEKKVFGNENFLKLALRKPIKV